MSCLCLGMFHIQINGVLLRMCKKFKQTKMTVLMCLNETVPAIKFEKFRVIYLQLLNLKLSCNLAHLLQLENM